MNFYHFAIIQKLRKVARKTGVISILKRIIGSGIYEDAFHSGMKKSIRQGDVVWDIGANVGFYTTQFARWTGEQGRVFAFEPLPEAAGVLREAIDKLEVAGSAPVTVSQVALSNRRGMERFDITGDGTDVTTTSRILEPDAVPVGGTFLEVQVETVDHVCKDSQFLIPQVTKIDVEGFEDDVLSGGAATFASPESREIFVEVHFTRLDERNRGDAPGRMVKMLQSWGYQVIWLDASHLHATRVS